MMQITRHEVPTTTIGTPPAVGEQLPDFTLLDPQNKTITAQQLYQKPALISVVPDINTRICDLQTKYFNQKMDDFTEINFFTVSTNTPEAQSDWCAAANVQKMILLSDQDQVFGKAMQLLMSEAPLDQRAIFIVDTTGKIVYSELIIEQGQEPDYQAALDFLKAHFN